MTRFFSVIVNSSLIFALLSPLSLGLKHREVSATSSGGAAIDSHCVSQQQQPLPSPPPPPEPIDPNNAPPQEKLPEDAYFYYFYSHPVRLTPIPDQVVVGLTRAPDNVGTIRGMDLSRAKRLSHEGAKITRLRLDIAGLETDLSDTLGQLRSHPAVRFASPMFEGPNASVRFFFGNTMTAKFKKGISETAIDQVLRSLNVTREREARWDAATWILDVAPSELNALEAANELFESGLVQYAEPNLTFAISTVEYETEAGPPIGVAASSTVETGAAYVDGWHLAKINAQDAWTLTDWYASHTPTVAIIDTGVDLDHPDIDDNLTSTGYDAVPDPVDTRGAPYPECGKNTHGTMVAGVVAAEINDFGADGAAGDFAKIMPVRVMSWTCNGELDTGDVNTISDGITYAYENGADVIVVTIDLIDTPLAQVFSVIKQAYLSGSVVVAPSSNDNRPSVAWPARFPGVIGVGGSVPDDTRWSEKVSRGKLVGSNYGWGLDVVAPTVGIHTTRIPGESAPSYDQVPGTCMAAPQVGAVAAMMRAVRPSLTPAQIQHIMQRTAQELGPYQYDMRIEEGGWNPETGFGVLNAYEAVRAAVQPVILSFTARLDWVDGENHSSQVAIAAVGPNSTELGKPRVVFSEDVTVTDNSGNGSVELYGLGPGTYTICAKPRHYLGRCVTRDLEPGLNLTIDFSEGGAYLFRPGDFNIGGEDAVVNGMDWEPFIRKWKTCVHTGDPDVCGEVDLDRNGTVNTRDVVIRHNTAAYAPYSDGDYPNDPERGKVWRPFKPDGAASISKSSSAEPASSPDVFLLGSSGSYGVGDIFKVDVWMDLRHASPGADSANAIVNYDPGVLEVIDANEDVEGIQVSPGPLFPNFDYNAVEERQGSISIGGYVGSDDPPVQSLDKLATVTFRATAAISPTEISVYLLPDETVDTNAAEQDTSVDVLSEAQSFAPAITGTPERARPILSIMPSSGYINSDFRRVSVQAEDPYDQVQWVQVQAYYDGGWHYVDTDSNGTDGWSVEWNTVGIDDQGVWLWAYAALPGGVGGSTETEMMALDRTQPTYLDHSFEPPSPSMAEQVDIRVEAYDNLVGVRRSEAYVNDATDGSSNGDWIKVGETGGASGIVTWETTAFEPGIHQVAFAIEDNAGNWNRWEAQDLPVITYTWGIAAPTADFTASPTSGKAPLPVDFTNVSTGDYDTCSWDFGEGDISTSCGNPSHEYAAPGTYTVTLSVDGPGGTDTEVKPAYVTVESLEYALDVTTVGLGTVTKEPDQAAYEYGDVVTLTATADPGWTFDGWSGDVDSTENPLETTIQDDTDVVATFTELPPGVYSLTVDTVGNGRVTLDPAGGVYDEGTIVEVTAEADAGWEFSGWSGDLSGDTNPESITMDENKTVIATFTENIEVYLPLVLANH